MNILLFVIHLITSLRTMNVNLNKKIDFKTAEDELSLTFKNCEEILQELQNPMVPDEKSVIVDFAKCIENELETSLPNPFVSKGCTEIVNNLKGGEINISEDISSKESGVDEKPDQNELQDQSYKLVWYLPLFIPFLVNAVALLVKKKIDFETPEDELSLTFKNCEGILQELQNPMMPDEKSVIADFAKCIQNELEPSLPNLSVRKGCKEIVNNLKRAEINISEDISSKGSGGEENPDQTEVLDVTTEPDEGKKPGEAEEVDPTEGTNEAKEPGEGEEQSKAENPGEAEEGKNPGEAEEGENPDEAEKDKKPDEGVNPGEAEKDKKPDEGVNPGEAEKDKKPDEGVNPGEEEKDKKPDEGKKPGGAEEVDETEGPNEAKEPGEAKESENNHSNELHCKPLLKQYFALKDQFGTEGARLFEEIKECLSEMLSEEEATENPQDYCLDVIERYIDEYNSPAYIKELKECIDNLPHNESTSPKNDNAEESEEGGEEESEEENREESEEESEEESREERKKESGFLITDMLDVAIGGVMDLFSLFLYY